MNYFNEGRVRGIRLSGGVVNARVQVKRVYQPRLVHGSPKKVFKYYMRTTFNGEFALTETVKVTRKYQVTIPENVRSELGVKIGDTLTVKSDGNHIIMESSKHISQPSEALWNLFGKSLDIDATKLVEESWTNASNSELKKGERKKGRRFK